MKRSSDFICCLLPLRKMQSEWWNATCFLLASRWQLIRDLRIQHAFHLPFQFPDAPMGILSFFLIKRTFKRIINLQEFNIMAPGQNSRHCLEFWVEQIEPAHRKDIALYMFTVRYGIWIVILRKGLRYPAGTVGRIPPSPPAHTQSSFSIC